MPFLLSAVTTTESPSFDASMPFLIIFINSCLNPMVFEAIYYPSNMLSTISLCRWPYVLSKSVTL